MLILGIAAAIGVWMYGLNLLVCHLVPRGMVTVGFMAIIGSVAVGGLAWLLVFLSEGELDISPRKPAIISTTAALLVVGINTGVLLAEIAQLKAMAPEVVAVGLARFEQLDRDGNGLLTREELSRAFSSLSIPDSEKQVINHIVRNMDEIGRPVIFLGTAGLAGGKIESGPLLPANPVYVIRKTELEDYGQRLADKYKP